MSFGDGNLHMQVAQLKTENARLKQQLEKLRTLNGDEIVRCMDCKYVAHFFHHDDERWQCANPHQDGDGVKPDAYCWRGKRKEGGDA